MIIHRREIVSGMCNQKKKAFPTDVLYGAEKKMIKYRARIFLGPHTAVQYNVMKH